MPVTVYDSTGQLTDISKVLRDNYEEKFYEILDNDTYMLQFFPRKTGKGAFVQWHAHYEGNDGIEWYDEDDEYGEAGQQKYENAQVEWKRVRINVKVSRFAQAVTAGTGAWIDALASEMEGAMNDLKDAINSAIILPVKNPNHRAIDSIGYIVHDGSTPGYEVYAGIDRTTNLWWAPVVLKNGTGDVYSLPERPLTIALMYQMRAELKKPRRKAKTTHILTSQTHADQFAELFADRRRWVDTETLSIGGEVLKWDGIPIVPVPHMEDGRMYFIDKSSWGYYTLIGFETEEVPNRTDADVFAIKQYAQLVCKEPQKQGLIANLAAD